MPTHIRAEQGDVAPIVLLPGNPDRATAIAERFFEHPVCYTRYRQMVGYTGTFRGVAVSVQTTGMGGPSAAIVCEELAGLGARTFVRVGTCGTLRDDIALGTLIAATGACAVGATVEQLVRTPGYAPTADFALTRAAVDAAARLAVPTRTGLVASMDLFYDDDMVRSQRLARYGVIALEMEAATVLTLGARAGMRAACLLVVSDLIATQQRAEPDALARAVDQMVAVALEAAISVGIETD